MSALPLPLQGIDLLPDAIQQVVGYFVTQSECAARMAGVLAGGKVARGACFDRAAFLADVAIDAAHLNAQGSNSLQRRIIRHRRQTVEQRLDFGGGLQDKIEVFYVD